jgi:hypothetical protein
LALGAEQFAQVTAWLAPPPTVGSVGASQWIGAEVSEAPVTVASAWPALFTVRTIENVPAAGAGSGADTRVPAVTSAAVWIVVAGEVVARPVMAVPVPPAVPFAVALKVSVPAPDTVHEKS